MNLDTRSLNSADYFVDEQNDGFKYHWFSANGGPPVRNRFVLPNSDVSEECPQNNRWSTRYFRVFRSDNAGQYVLVNVVPKRGQGRVSTTMVITEGDLLVRIERDVNPRGGVLLNIQELAPGQELGLIISMVDAS